jgi:hypothetical protein
MLEQMFDTVKAPVSRRCHARPRRRVDVEEAMRAWQRVVGGLVVAGLAGGCGVIPDPEAQARRYATDAVRAQAERTGTGFWAALRATDAGGAHRVVRDYEELLGRFRVPAGPRATGVIGGAVGGDGTARLDLAFRDQSQAGGGLSYAGVVVMLCVRMTGTPGPGGEVRLANLACPSELVETGLVDEVVTLAREGPPPAPDPPRPACHSGGDDCPGG